VLLVDSRFRGNDGWEGQACPVGYDSGISDVTP